VDLHADAHIAFPPALVFAACRDDLPKLLPFLPSIRSIEVTARQQRGRIVENVVDWCSGRDLPAPLRALMGPSLLSWTDYATWNEDTLSCDWHTETHAFTKAVRCEARDRFLQDGPSKTLLEIRGVLEVDARKIAGVPGFLASTVGRAMEEFLVGKIKSDLVKTAEGLERLLSSQETESSPVPSAAHR
jgi:hypothetical protein